MKCFPAVQAIPARRLFQPSSPRTTEALMSEQPLTQATRTLASLTLPTDASVVVSYANVHAQTE